MPRPVSSTPAFAPVLSSSVEVITGAADGNSIYIGGDFNTVNGTNRRKVARLNAATGALITSFNASGVNGIVRDFRLVGNTLYIAGLFTTRRQPAAHLPRLAQRHVGCTHHAAQPDARRAAQRWRRQGHQDRRHTRRQPDADHRQLHDGRRPAPRPGGADRPVDQPGDGQPVAHQLLQLGLLDVVRQLHPRSRHLRGRHVRRDLHHRCLPRQHLVRHGRPPRVDPRAGQPHADVGQLHRWRHVLRRRDP